MTAPPSPIDHWKPGLAPRGVIEAVPTLVAEQRRRCACGEPVTDTDECDRCWMAGELEYERNADR